MKQGDKIKILLEALKYFYPTYFGEEARSTGSIFEYGGQKYSKDWVISETFKLTNIPEKTSDIGIAIRELEKIAGSATVEVPEAPSSTGPNKEIISEEAIKKNEARIAERKTDTEKSNQDVRDAIKRQQENYEQEIQKTKALEEKLKGQKVNYEVQKNTVDESQEIKNLREQAKADPQGFINDATKHFEESLNLKGLTSEEAGVAAKQAAVTLHDILTDNPNSPLLQAVIAEKIVSDPKLLNKFAPNPEDQNALKDVTSILTDRKSAQFELLGQLVDLQKIKQVDNVVFLDSPSPNSREFNVSDITTQDVNLLGDQNQLLGNLTSFGEGEIKSRFLLSVGTRLNGYVTSLPVNSSLARIYNSEIVQLGLSSIGIVEAPAVVAIEGSLMGKLIVSSGLGNVARIIQAKTGISLGVKVAAKAGAKVAEKVIITGGEVAAEGATGVGIAATVTAALVPILGPLIAPIVGAAVRFLIDVVGAKIIGWISSKIPWKKIAPWLLGGGIFLVAGPVVGVAVGLGTFALVSRGGFGAVVGGARIFFRALGGNVYERILKIFIIAFILFCVIVVIVLFIINSGAYVVPPTPFSLQGNPYIDVAKTVEPDSKHENTELASGIKVAYHIKVTAKKNTLNNIRIEHTCEIINKAGTTNCPAPLPSIVPPTVSPDSPYVFDYSQTFSGNRYLDSLIVNTFKVTADSTDAKDQSASGTASVLVGNPPTGCFKLDGSWKDSNKKAAINKAIVRLTQATAYSVRLCQRGTVTLKYLGLSSWGGWTIDANTIGIYDYGVVLGDTATLYTLAHESGHVFAARTGQYSDDYINKPDLAAERPICSYPVQAHPASEDFAEMIGLYVAKDADTANGIACGMFGNGFKEKYPAHWNYANKSIFGGQMLGW